MKTKIIGLAILFIFVLSSCQKKAIIENNTNSITTVDSISNVDLITPTIYSEQGVYGVFGAGSSWEYLTINSGSGCVVDSMGNISTFTDSTYLVDSNEGEFITNNRQFFKIGQRLIHIKNGVYYWLSNGVLVKYMVENPVVGMTWKTSVPLNFNGGISAEMTDIVYSYTIKETNLTLSTNLGTLNNVVEVREEHNGSPRTNYYKEGIGLVKRLTPMMNSQEERELIRYDIQPL